MATARRSRVLIVDDDLAILNVLGGFLEESGFVVDRALHGADAIMAVSSARPDVVLLDLRMEGLQGMEVLRRMRAMDATIPVIIVTGHDDPGYRRETHDLGALDFLVKPVDLDRLKQAIVRALTPPHDRPGPADRP